LLRTMGKTAVSELQRGDLCTVNPDIARALGIRDARFPFEENHTEAFGWPAQQDQPRSSQSHLPH